MMGERVNREPAWWCFVGTTESWYSENMFQIYRFSCMSIYIYITNWYLIIWIILVVYFILDPIHKPETCSDTLREVVFVSFFRWDLGHTFQCVVQSISLKLRFSKLSTFRGGNPAKLTAGSPKAMEVWFRWIFRYAKGWFFEVFTSRWFRWKSQGCTHFGVNQTSKILMDKKIKQPARVVSKSQK